MEIEQCKFCELDLSDCGGDCLMSENVTKTGKVLLPTRCNECGGSHEPSGARSDCIDYWKRRALNTESALASALSEYPRIPEEVWIGTDSDVDRVRWLARRCGMNDRTITHLHKELDTQKKSQKAPGVCDEHEWPYGMDLDGDNRPMCVWCEALRADALEQKLLASENHKDSLESAMRIELDAVKEKLVDAENMLQRAARHCHTQP